MTEPNTQREWEEKLTIELDLFVRRQANNEEPIWKEFLDFAISLFSTELTKAREEGHAEGMFEVERADNVVKETALQSYRQELRKMVEGKSKSCTDECMSQFYDHDCCDCGAREYNQCKDDLLTIISE